jgi:hypothetical protein
MRFTEIKSGRIAKTLMTVDNKPLVSMVDITGAFADYPIGPVTSYYFKLYSGKYIPVSKMEYDRYCEGDVYVYECVSDWVYNALYILALIFLGIVIYLLFVAN